MKAGGSQEKGCAYRWLVALVWVYFTFLFAWLVAYILFGDRWGYLAQINILAVYLYWPFLLILLLAVFLRHRGVWIMIGVGAAVFVWLWGGLLTPQLAKPEVQNPALRVMTYNVLGMHNHAGPVIEVIRGQDADVVFLQELNPFMAASIVQDLSNIYPYRILDPEEGVAGTGTLGKYPLHLTGETLPRKWVGVPQIMMMEWQGEQVTLVNFHMWATHFAPPDMVTANFRAREAQAQALADFARGVETPLIAGGDANASDLSDAYQIVTGDLSDAWREAGFGFGNTFPGSDIPGSSRPHVGPWPVPMWLARIDYVFHSDEWITLQAWMAPFDGVSDHRGVVVEVMLVDE
jgi:endonuclease/exonuclease/phosphatase (EEP) superfamily protein YafD